MNHDATIQALCIAVEHLLRTAPCEEGPEADERWEIIRNLNAALILDSNLSDDAGYRYRKMREKFLYLRRVSIGADLEEKDSKRLHR